MVAQSWLPIKFESETNSTGLTALGGLPVFLELMATLGLPEQITEQVGLRPEQGWSDLQQVAALVCLKLAGGDALSDLDQLEADDGWCEIVERVEQHRLRGEARRRAVDRCHRGGERTHPSPSAAREYLQEFEPEQVCIKAAGPQGAQIPEPSDALEGLRDVVARPVQWSASRPADESTATLDIDATVAASANRSADRAYTGVRGYQPLNVFWFERRQILFSEFRDGNCPAAWRVEEVLEQAESYLPDQIEELRVRSDTAGYHSELLRAMAEGTFGQRGEIEFAVGVPIHDAVRSACLEVDDEDWAEVQTQDEGGDWHGTNREYAHVPFVPNWLAHTKRDLGIRFLALREPLDQVSLPDIDEPGEQAELPFPTMEFQADGYKITAIVTNSDRPDCEVIDWYYERCGLSEKAHSECKADLGGQPFPSADNFQANAAWWQLTVLAFNLQKLLQRDFLRDCPGPLRRMKWLRFHLISVPGRVVKHAGQMTLRVPEGHPSLDVIRPARQLMVIFRRGPPGPWMEPAV